jgi:hypothetical protein
MVSITIPPSLLFHPTLDLAKETQIRETYTTKGCHTRAHRTTGQGSAGEDDTARGQGGEATLLENAGPSLGDVLRILHNMLLVRVNQFAIEAGGHVGQASEDSLVFDRQVWLGLLVTRPEDRE